MCFCGSVKIPSASPSTTSTKCENAEVGEPTVGAPVEVVVAGVTGVPVGIDLFGFPVSAVFTSPATTTGAVVCAGSASTGRFVAQPPLPCNPGIGTPEGISPGIGETFASIAGNGGSSTSELVVGKGKGIFPPICTTGTGVVGTNAPLSKKSCTALYSVEFS